MGEVKEIVKSAPKASVANISLEEVLSQVGSIYKLCNLAAKRALELSEGSPKLAESDSAKPTTIALAEIRMKRVNFKSKEEKGE